MCPSLHRELEVGLGFEPRLGPPRGQAVNHSDTDLPTGHWVGPFLYDLHQGRCYHPLFTEGDTDGKGSLDTDSWNQGVKIGVE